jgi:hypothetical protein
VRKDPELSSRGDDGCCDFFDQAAAMVKQTTPVTKDLGVAPKSAVLLPLLEMGFSMKSSIHTFWGSVIYGHLHIEEVFEDGAMNLISLYT